MVELLKKQSLQGNVYGPGLLHPVQLGEVYHNRYKVLRKLGYGKYSTVWLVKDITQDSQYLAMKVLSAGYYGSGNDVFQFEIMEHLRDANPEHPGRQYISILLDSFEHVGPNGWHNCFIFPGMG